MNQIYSILILILGVLIIINGVKMFGKSNSWFGVFKSILVILFGLFVAGLLKSLF